MNEQTNELSDRDLEQVASGKVVGGGPGWGWGWGGWGWGGGAGWGWGGGWGWGYRSFGFSRWWW